MRVHARVQRDVSQACNNINCLRVPEQLEMHAQDNTVINTREVKSGNLRAARKGMCLIIVWLKFADN